MLNIGNSVLYVKALKDIFLFLLNKIVSTKKKSLILCCHAECNASILMNTNVGNSESIVLKFIFPFKLSRKP